MSRLGLKFALLVGTAACGFYLPGGSSASPMAPAPVLPVGWHDELQNTSKWTPHPAGQKPGFYRPRVGGLGLTVSPPRQEARKEPFYWASLHRVAEVDLDQYPVLAVRTRHVSKGAWWDVMAQEVKDGAPVGREVRTQSLREPGLLLLDLPREAGLTGRRQVRVRLNVAHENGNGRAAYAWVRFIQRTDVDTLRRHPDLPRVLLSP